ncbi:type III secretion system cytoplasmic ring protein SctQ [Bordetella genomosp. 8]|nr:type III secretion system cytoplasmic ring protein SctQ [Bordetella genomosp. 8]
MSGVPTYGASEQHREPLNGENARGAAWRWVMLDWQGAQLALQLSSRVFDEWLALRMPDLDLAPLPPCFVHAAWEDLIRDAFEGLGIERRCPGIRVLGVDAPAHPGLPAPAYPYAWTLTMHAPASGRAVSARLAVDEPGLPLLSELLGRIPPGQDTTETDLPGALPIRLTVLAGETTLRSEALRRLETGDVVLFDHSLASLDGDAWLATPDGQGLGVRACGPGASRYVVTQEWSSLRMNDYPSPEDHYGIRQDHDHDREHGQDFSAGSPPHAGEHFPFEDDASPAEVEATAMPHPSAAMPKAGTRPGADGPDVDRIPVHLVFDLGELNMPLGELRRLRPGEFFDLQRRIDAGPVHIRANGTLIGTAELVDIDGRIGARVLTLFPGRDSWG